MFRIGKADLKIRLRLVKDGGQEATGPNAEQMEAIIEGLVTAHAAEHSYRTARALCFGIIIMALVGFASGAITTPWAAYMTFWYMVQFSLETWARHRATQLGIQSLALFESLGGSVVKDESHP